MSTPVGALRRARWLLVLSLGCSTKHLPSDDPVAEQPSPGTCSVTEHVEIPLDLFGEQTEPPRLFPLADRFGVLGSAPITLTRQADVAVVSWQGVDETHDLELSGLCPDDVCRNVHGTAVLGAASGGVEFVLAEQGSSTSMQAYPLRLMGWNGGPSDPLLTPLFDAHITAITTRSDMKASRDGTRATFVLGNIDSAELHVAEIAEGGTVILPSEPIALAAPAWDCIEVVPTNEAGAISAVTRADDGTEVVWHLLELGAEANLIFGTNLSVPVGDALGFTDCPTVVDGPAGFHAQWTSSDGASVIASMARDAGPEQLGDAIRVDPSPGSLEAVLGDEFLFRGGLDDGAQGFLRLTRKGEPGGPALELPSLPESTPGRRRAAPEVLRVNGSSFDVTYELESTRVLERFDCRLR